MRADGSSVGDRHPELLFWYIVFFTLALLQSIVASPKRGLPQGQPELPQEMDNLKAPLQGARNDIDAFEGLEGRRKLLICKTMNVLLDAESLLHTGKDVQEHRWLETFVQRLKGLAEVLEKGVETSLKKHTDTHNTTVEQSDKGNSHSLRPLSMPDTNAPEEKQSFELTFKSPATLPEENEVDNNQAVAKLEVLLFSQTKKLKENSLKDDPLVRELEALRSPQGIEKMPKPMKFQTDSFKKGEVKAHGVSSSPSPAEVAVNPDPVATTASPVEVGTYSDKSVFSTQSNTADFPNAVSASPQKTSMVPTKQLPLANSEMKKDADRNLHRLVQDLEQFRGRSESMKSPYVGGPSNQEVSNFNRIPNGNFPLSSKAQYQTSQDYISDGSMIPRMNPNGWRQSDVPYPTNHFLNGSFQEMRMNSSPINHQISNRRYFSNYAYYPQHHVSYHGIKNTIQNLKNQHHLAFGNQKQNQYPNYFMKAYDTSNGKNNPLPFPANPNVKFFNERYNPNPKMLNDQASVFNAKNHTHGNMPTNKAVTNSFSPKLNSEFSDEMKRDLRDGKVILLSDSVVPSNFEEKDTETTVTSQVDAAERKNGTVAQV